MTYKLKDGFVLRKVGPMYMAVPWKALETGTDTLEGLVAALRAEYDVSEEQATADTQAFLDSLREQGVLEA